MKRFREDSQPPLVGCNCAGIEDRNLHPLALVKVIETSPAEWQLPAVFPSSPAARSLRFLREAKCNNNSASNFCAGNEQMKFPR